ncbi:hypothetical protein KP509_13G095000 [Ceratopteris richardii]|uniref:Uncharacterized protein n=1 Tax=Ceratopteris richardii TaxID=49495 RepID=A0A8T2TL63_CERRI|nr:hypothetical protein KP509_13G095000 [Ceratopteris richardii]
MGGVWYFGSDGVARFVRDNSRRTVSPYYEEYQRPTTSEEPKVLIYRPTNQVVRSFNDLQGKLMDLGWRKLSPTVQHPRIMQFLRCGPSSIHLITLPTDFSCFSFLHMVDILMKNHEHFAMRDHI